MKHTEGEWKIGSYSPNQDEYREIIIPEKKLIARVFNQYWGDVTKDEGEANAKLIAASPDLLEALERFVKFVDDQKLEYESAMVIQAKLAIQKAKS